LLKNHKNIFQFAHIYSLLREFSRKGSGNQKSYRNRSTFVGLIRNMIREGIQSKRREITRKNKFTESTSQKERTTGARSTK